VGLCKSMKCKNGKKGDCKKDFFHH
jgi:hypothetical protein